MLYLTPSLVTESVGDLVSSTSDLEFELPVFADRDTRDRLAALHRLFQHRRHEFQQDNVRELLVLVLGESLIRRREAPPALPASLARVRQRLDDDPATLVDLALLAREAGLSRFQLIRAFQRHTGLTPHAYQMQSRANLSRRLLMEGLLPAEVAAACGYVDQSHMHREFRRRFGLTPGAYRSARLCCNPVQDGSA
jgi:AraC-like DNA-binding protein